MKNTPIELNAVKLTRKFMFEAPCCLRSELCLSISCVFSESDSATDLRFRCFGVIMSARVVTRFDFKKFAWPACVSPVVVIMTTMPIPKRRQHHILLISPSSSAEESLCVAVCTLAMTRASPGISSSGRSGQTHPRKA